MTYISKKVFTSQELFNEFVENIRHLDGKKSLKFVKQSETRIDLSYREQSYYIQLDASINSDEKGESKLIGASVNDGKKRCFLMDEDGVVHLPGDGGEGGLGIKNKPIGNEPSDSERLFFLLLGGKPDFKTNYLRWTPLSRPLFTIKG